MGESDTANNNIIYWTLTSWEVFRATHEN